MIYNDVIIFVLLRFLDVNKIVFIFSDFFLGFYGLLFLRLDVNNLIEILREVFVKL